ncbi:DedA family protein [Paraclostridium sordellii]|uniref:DedA family protein n=1 Tax=Paraclostridium sordellii TaxID=1505 RepID=UPI0005DABB4D|nr:DedA family protein [Paeniclostridium sordellii]CEO06359.1 DedA family protein [[Clostridium] sordellii] [Paeniclostridium sordellii]
MNLRIMIEYFIINYGLISIFIIVALEYSNIPLPSEVILPMVGILATKYNMNFVFVLIISILGGLVGCLLNYYIGIKFGKPLLDKIIKKFPTTKKSINESYRFITKYDKASVLIARIVPVARTIISIVAGVGKMNIFSSIGIGIWNLTLIYLGYIIGDNLNLIGILIKKYSVVILIVILIVLITYFIKKFINFKKNLK